ncbi:ECF RNA polymerase sigma factor SigW [Caulifigura coniformis]|uniref:ECF RNA polymerase sigma factor SigW n=1 Tax=Caulifigura coniformis TaxID=2527983 RepID=A0A517S899_9PLAN|nr:RNA polymerase sigma factor [Caulifigura coniformis]QDT52354.1 ECF RNA polymerase sigma factor SigW [Caulifigura coniformis]
MKESPLPADERPRQEDEQGQWIARTVQPALAFAITLVRNRHDAEDIVQECYRKLLARSGHYNLPRDGVKLLYKSITNAAINHVQRRPATRTSDDLGDVAFPPHAQDGQPPEARLLEQELESAIEQALAQLPVNQRAVLELSGLGHSLLDVAEILNISHGNARVLLHRARQSVAAKLKVFREGEVS